MSCPTCSHTMQRLCEEPRPFWWCPRCGTLREASAGGFVRDEAPKLVGRVRQFHERASGASGENPKITPSGEALWRTLGIAESISSPNERPVT